MDMLLELIHHDAWANRVVLQSFASSPATLDVICYDGTPVMRHLRHPLGTERAFLDIFRGEPRRPDVPSDIEALIAYDAETASGLEAAVRELGPSPERAFFVPWFEREFEFQQLVHQVVSHSAQHRAEHAWELARAGVNTGELGLISWLAAGRPGPGESLMPPSR